jgi:hypothetical protein
MKIDQTTSSVVDKKVIELVKPRKIERAYFENDKEVESLCTEYGAGLRCGGNGGIEEDDLLF